MEIFPIVDSDGNVTGSASRTECHGGSRLLHPVVHLHVIDGHGHILLQQRSEDKDIQPGKWDTAVGGHVDYGETIAEALRRESREELGLHDIDAPLVERYLFESDRERELVHVHILTVDPMEIQFTPDPGEIQRIAWWSYEEVTAATGAGLLTPNFESEFARIRPRLSE